MAWICVDCDGTEWFSSKKKPHRTAWGYWADAQVVVGDEVIDTTRNLRKMPKGTIEKLLKLKMTWEDEPVECMDDYNKIVG